MKRKYKLINKSDRVIGVSVTGMEQVFNLPPNGEDILLDHFYINHLTETIKIFKGDIILEEIIGEALEELSRKESLDRHTELSQKLQPEGYTEKTESLFNKVTDEGEIVPIRGYIKPNTEEININKDINEELNKLYVSLKLGEESAELGLIPGEELFAHLKEKYNFEDTKANAIIVEGIADELELSRRNIELLEKMKDFNHDDDSLMLLDELEELDLPDDDIIKEGSVPPNFESLEELPEESDLSEDEDEEDIPPDLEPIKQSTKPPVKTHKKKTNKKK